MIAALARVNQALNVPMQVIDRLVVVGVGLIGGSLALALKSAGMVRQVVGVGRSAENLHWAQQHGIIDVSCELVDALQGANVVLLATPVGQMPAVMQAMSPHLAAGTLVTDAGSTKQDVVDCMVMYLPQHLRWCVPAHPIAGAEFSGARAARADLFCNRNVVLTPLDETDEQALAQITQLWQHSGASVGQMSAGEHDAVFAAVSHLPHVLAFALVDMLARRDNAAQLFAFAASGFRDFTRIAGSSPEMWRDIALANQPALLRELDAYQAQLTQLRAALAKEDGDALMESFSLASAARIRWENERM